ncbi:MAG: T9SS type A sorting domain-containing protein [Bacteroidetes bacterium]|nr:T9SS type A sorting domain-containing protein [Bacteroidota bacterium]
MKQFLPKLLVICFLVSSWVAANAQDPSEGITEMGDTLVIQPTYNGSILNALNNWILWDHDNDYANAPKHKVYKLLRNNIYVVQTTTKLNGRLALVADTPDKDNKPPQVIPINDGVNAFPWLIFQGGPFTLKNIYFTALNATTQSNDAWQHLMHLTTPDQATIIDGCIFENLNAHTLKITAPGNKIYMTNNFFSDGGAGWTSIWQGNFFNSEDKMQDSLIIRNNTYMNTPGNLINIRKQMSKYVEVSNNTLINCGGYPFFTTFWTNATIKNNLFYNVLAVGEDETVQIAQDPDQLAYSMINIDTLANEFPMADPTWLERESERKFVVKNNYYGWDEEVEAIWAGRDTVFAPTWMNERTLAFFADNDNYPLVVEENNTTKADIGVPTFETPIPTTPDFIKWIDEGVWGNPQTPGIRVLWEPEGVTEPNNDLDWPPLEDLRLTNAAFVGDDGRPMGDLNWYIDYAERWDMTDWGRGTPTAVENMNITTKTLRNYPNPFVNSTKIEFSLTNKSDVLISVYDMSGKKVKILMSEQRNAGNHSVTWDGTNSAGQNLSEGFYIYQLKINTQIMSDKMLKVN